MVRKGFPAKGIEPGETVVCGEEFNGSQQGKIHSRIVELDGWLYFTTHFSNYWPEGIDIYPGAHVLGYEMATGKFRDYGIVRPRYSIYSAIQVDPGRKILYVFVAPFQPDLVKNDGAHLYSVDIETGGKKTLGSSPTDRWEAFPGSMLTAMAIAGFHSGKGNGSKRMTWAISIAIMSKLEKSSAMKMPIQRRLS